MLPEQNGMDRRQFLKAAAAGIAAGVMAYSKGPELITTGLETANNVFQWLSEVRERGMEKRIGYPEAGWLETSLADRPPLINAKKGCADYIRHASLNQPVLRVALKEAYTDFFGKKDEKAVKLGDMFLKHIGYAKNALIDVMHKGDERLKDTPPTMENIVHVAVFTLAAVLSPYLTAADIESLGVDLMDSRGADNNDIRWLRFVGKNLPHLLPAYKFFCRPGLDMIARCEGGDRTFHLAQHLFLTHELQYTKDKKLQDADRIPRGARLAQMITPIPELKTLVVGQSGGLFWEIHETKEAYDGRVTLDEKGIPIASGFYDLQVGKDFQANLAGAIAGMYLSRVPLDDITIRLVAGILNNPLLYIEASREKSKVAFARAGEIYSAVAA
jgi:hypothetical protein